MHVWDECAFKIDIDSIRGRECYGGLDLSSTTDITAFVMVFPPRTADEKYIVLPYFWIPDNNLKTRVRCDHVPYDVWEQQDYIKTTEGNVVQNLEGMGFTVVLFGQGYKDMSPSLKELMKLTLDRSIRNENKTSVYDGRGILIL